MFTPSVSGRLWKVGPHNPASSLRWEKCWWMVHDEHNGENVPPHLLVWYSKVMATGCSPGKQSYQGGETTDTWALQLVTGAGLLRIKEQMIFRKLWQQIERKLGTSVPWGDWQEEKRASALEGLRYQESRLSKRADRPDLSSLEQKMGACRGKGNCLVIGSETPDQTEMINERYFVLD